MRTGTWINPATLRHFAVGASLILVVGCEEPMDCVKHNTGAVLIWNDDKRADYNVFFDGEFVKKVSPGYMARVDMPQGEEHTITAEPIGNAGLWDAVVGPPSFKKRLSVSACEVKEFHL